MKFVGTVIYAKRQDHDDDGPKNVTDIRLGGTVDGNPVWIELAIPTRLASAYGIGRRVVVTATPT